jgi:hypothetical protein
VWEFVHNLALYENSWRSWLWVRIPEHVRLSEFLMAAG